jgi:protein-L-isoaspartate(D-aspartate) O-methyltransferase
LQIKKGDKVLEIGTGSMYQTSVLAEMGAQVFTIERQKQLFDKTAKYVFKDLYLNVNFFFGDGFEGLPHLAPFDKILITAAAPHLPEKLWAQLKTSGKMIIPLDESETAQRMMRLTKKRDGSVKKEAFDQFSFVPMLQGKTQK